MAVGERVEAWQCIGCGRLEGPRPCIGVCQDRKVELVNASELDRALARIVELEAMMRVLVQVTPKQGEWERSYRLLQVRARRLLGG